MRIRILSGALALGVAAACGASEDDMFRAESVPLEELPQRYAEAVCEAYTRCVGPLVDVFLQGEDCVRRTRTALSDELPAIEAAIEAGRIEYRGDRLEACTAEVRAWTCSELLNRDPEVCRAAFDGTVELGGDCTMSDECAGAAYCRFDTSCPGVCTELEGVDGACRRDSECAPGLVCSDTRQRCEEPTGAGGLCQAGYPDCAPGYACAGGSEEEARPGHCRTYDEVLVATAGSGCNPVTGQLCEPGVVCQIDAVSADGFSASCAAPVSAGAACRAAFPDQCPEGQYCEIPANMLEGTCKPRPAAGEPCGKGPFDDTASICGAFARCDGGTCRSLAHLGESCSSDALCYSEHCLDGVCAGGGSCE